MERRFGLLGAAYRFNSEDTRNSPTLFLARLLLAKGCAVKIHDPYVYPTDQNLKRFDLQSHFTQDLGEAVQEAEYLFVCTGHKVYADDLASILRLAPRLKGVVDGCNVFRRSDFAGGAPGYAGIGRGRRAPDDAFLDFVYRGFRAVEVGLANEVKALVDFLNTAYADGQFNQVRFTEVQRIAGTCVTGCAIADAGPVEPAPSYHGFIPRLARLASHD